MNKILSIALLLGIISCSSDKPEGKTEAEILFKEAQELVNSKRYILATEKLNQIKTQHPYSFYATPAELMQAEVLFYQENFVEAAASFLLFRDFHPRHEKISYVIFMIGESYFNQIPSTIDRDLEPALEALKYYQEILTKYEETSYKQDALDKIKKCMEMLRAKDKYIADFYFKTKVFQAAQFWYVEILERHDDKKTREHAISRLILADLNLKEFDNCISHADKFSEELSESLQKEVSDTVLKCKQLLSQEG